MSYGWPVEPFDKQHAVRGFFCDPRIGGQGQKSFHSEGAENIAVIGAHEHAYWHIVPTVQPGEQVAKHTLIGHIAKSWGHVHLAERTAGQYWNPLRAGALTPFQDYGAPVIDRILAERAGSRLDPAALTGVVNLIAEAHDNPPISAPPPWHGFPVTPALLRWRLVRDAAAVVPWTTVADFRTTLIPKARFDAVYAVGTRQNHPNAPGLYRFWLARNWDTRRHRDGSYRLDVEAADIRANAPRGHLELGLANGAL